MIFYIQIYASYGGASTFRNLVKNKNHWGGSSNSVGSNMIQQHCSGITRTSWMRKLRQVREVVNFNIFSFFSRKDEVETDDKTTCFWTRDL